MRVATKESKSRLNLRTQTYYTERALTDCAVRANIDVLLSVLCAVRAHVPVTHLGAPLTNDTLNTLILIASQIRNDRRTCWTGHCVEQGHLDGDEIALQQALQSIRKVSIDTEPMDPHTQLVGVNDERKCFSDPGAGLCIDEMSS